MVNITNVDWLRLATSLDYANSLSAIADPSHVSFLSYNATFASDILGPNAGFELVAEESWQAFHEAGVYNRATGSIYVASNFQSLSNNINITVVDINNHNSITSRQYPHLAESNGGTAYYPPGPKSYGSDDQQIVFCSQGGIGLGPSQLVVVDPKLNTGTVLVDQFLGRNFTSLNDVEQHPATGDLWFTDARYAYWQGFEYPPKLPPQVYRFEPRTGVINAVADGFVAPNGIEISPDLRSVYVTDSGSITKPNTNDPTGPATIYKYDITPDGKRLENRQLFAYPDNGIPDGIHTDTDGNVYSGCGDGVHVWNPAGILLGKIVVQGGVANFVFVPGGMYLFNGKKLWKVTLQAEGRTVKRDFGRG